MAEIKYTIKLPPITKKNSQQILYNKSTGRPFIMPSANYKKYEREAAWHLRPRLRQPIDYPVNVKCEFYMPTKRRTDLNNLLEAATDLLVYAGILADDHYGIVASHDGSRCYIDRNNPRTEITISRIVDPAQESQM
jgi:Holliday junction resolvase RusA-like endonuclease